MYIRKKETKKKNNKNEQEIAKCICRCIMQKEMEGVTSFKRAFHAQRINTIKKMSKKKRTKTFAKKKGIMTDTSHTFRNAKLYTLLKQYVKKFPKSVNFLNASRKR